MYPIYKTYQAAKESTLQLGSFMLYGYQQSPVDLLNWRGRSLMTQWLQRASQGHELYWP